MWSNSLRTALYSAALVEYLSSGSLITLSQASEVLGSELFAAESAEVRTLSHIFPVKEEWADRFSVAVEDYLHGLISLVNELVNEDCPFSVFRKMQNWPPQLTLLLVTTCRQCSDARRLRSTTSYLGLCERSLCWVLDGNIS